MSVRYKKTQNKMKQSENYGKWYGRAFILDSISTRQLADEISHSTTVTYADVLAVLAELTSAMKQHLQNSQKIVLDGLGSFRVGLRSKLVDKKEDFSASKITGFRIVYSPEVHFTPTGVTAKGGRTGIYTKTLLDGIQVKEYSLDEKSDGTTAGDGGSTAPEA